ncbi:MAG: hypothetical protein Kapaf2KO_13220 [Candidatus Kapaibacteriales bacterium]
MLIVSNIVNAVYSRESLDPQGFRGRQGNEQVSNPLDLYLPFGQENSTADQQSYLDILDVAFGNRGAVGSSGDTATESELNTESTEDTEKNASSPANNELSDAEQEVVKDLKARDREVRQHEQAHVAAGGGLIRGGPTYSYQRGPDGRQYAIGGEVQIDNAPVAGDPDATILKMNRVIRAALAPAEPSAQDRSVARSAQSEITKARTEKFSERPEGVNTGQKIDMMV